MKKHLIALLVSLTAYVLFGLWGLSLAIPPGFSSVVWPAAGFALACALIFSSGYAILGILLGSFLVNIWMFSGYGEDISLSNMLAGAAISVGAMLQAVFGRYLFRRHMGSSSVLTISQNFPIFTLLVAPIGCLIGASFGCLTLLSVGFISTEHLAFSWFTWWLGDTIGVLLFTPLLLALISREPSLTLGRKAQIISPALFIFLVVWMLFRASIEGNRDDQIESLKNSSLDIANEIQNRVTISEQKTIAFSALFKSMKNVDKEQFNQFSKEILQNDSVFHGIGWVDVINHKDRKRIESEIKNNGYPEFEFKEISRDGLLIRSKVYQEYNVVRYMYPIKKNEKAIGLNLSANLDRKLALHSAREQNLPVATAPIILAQETESMKATILYVPIYESPSNFLGYIGGVMRIKGILGDILAKYKQKNIAISINDVTNKDDIKPFLISNEAQLESFPSFTYSMKFGSRNYQMEIYADNDYLELKKDWSSWVLLTGGFFFSAILLILLLNIANTIALVNKQVKVKTKELRQAVERAEAANKAKSNFLANMSHELRTPLNAIMGFINLAIKEKDDKKRGKFLTDSGLASGTLLSLINQSLDYAKIESGRLELDLCKVSLLDKLKKLEAIFNQQAEDKKLDFSVVIINELPKFVSSDSLRIEQVCLNLLSNAVKFTQKGYVKLIISGKRHANYIDLTLSVEDTGIGISEKNHQTIFDAFKQEDSSTSRRYGGTGLGLSISRELTELMGGHIDLDPTYESGCRFVVSLELKVLESGQSFSQMDFDRNGFITEDDSQSSLIPDDCLAGVSILLAEDILMNQIVAQEILQSFGAKVTVADNGKIAVEMLTQENNFNLVLMDIQMPKMDGYEATRIIRRQSAFDSLPILAMTANAMDSDVKACLEAGMQAHVAKPIDENILITTILKFIK